ncbi:MAG: hypothetical protein H0V83_04740 [Rubrobacter sp.]|nr:hypothetical protein [Rubrobacter sp.]
MANLTITVDAQTLKRARMRALEEDTSVNAVLRDYLEEYAGVRRERLEAMRKILESSRESTSGSGPGGRTWKREDAYEDRLRE